MLKYNFDRLVEGIKQADTGTDACLASLQNAKKFSVGRSQDKQSYRESDITVITLALSYRY